jgi:NAD(P)-dependent dehydrogenase (short-subunit alcohol dehydrogenase family)
LNEKVKTAVLTGATSGIGTVIADQLAKSGYTLIILGRSEERNNDKIHKILEKYPGIKIEGILCELASIQSTKRACEKIRNSYTSIDLLILNAGLWNFKFVETEDQIEETFQVNLLSSFLIFGELNALIPRDGQSKVIFTTSGLHQGMIEFDNIEFRKNFSGFRAYRQSKLGLIMLAKWLSRHEKYSNISFYSVHPGMVNTKLGRNAGFISRSVFILFGSSKNKGAKTHQYLIDTPPEDLESGGYYAKSALSNSTDYSRNMDAAERLSKVLTSYLIRC